MPHDFGILMSWQNKFGGQKYTEYIGTDILAGAVNPFWVIGRVSDTNAAIAEGEERRAKAEEAKNKHKK